MTSAPEPSARRDTGGADPAVTNALEAYARGEGAAAAVSALSRSRLLVPIVSVPGEARQDGSGLSERSAEVAVALMRRADGRAALLAFTGLAALRRWDAAARPRPLSVPDTARAALAEGATAILLDVAGPHRFAVETDELEHWAAGHVSALTSSGYVWLAPREDPQASRTCTSLR